MENFTFWSPTECVFGRGTELRTGELAARFGAHKIMIVSGGGSAERSGLLARIRKTLQDAGLEYVDFAGVRPNPVASKVYEGIGIARAEKADFLLAVGGGSVIDTAKAIALGAPADTDFWKFYNGEASPQKAMPVGVVLTIPAAGSEGSGNSVITNEKTLQKISVRYPMLLRPKFAVMNPELTMTLLANQTAYGIVDMLCHIYERYFSNTAGTEIVDGYSEAIMRDIMDQATTLHFQPDNYEARAEVMWGGMLAHNGLCGVGKVEDWSSHRLEHEISAIYDVPHGAGLAVIVPAWLKFCARHNPDKIWKFAINVMSVDPSGHDTDEIIAEGISRLEDFYHDLGLTTSLRELIGQEPDIETMVCSLERNMGPTLGNYVTLSMDDCREIYRMAL